MGSKSHDSALMRREDTETQPASYEDGGRDGNLPQVKDCLGPSEQEEARADSSLRDFRRNMALDFKFLASKTHKKSML